MNMGLDRGRDSRYSDTQEVFPDIPGLADEPDFYRFSSGVLADYRDLPADPDRGGMVGLLFSHYREKGNSRYQFRRYTLDARHYFPIEGISSVLALRAFTSVDDPSGTGEVPFYLMETLGGGGALRGFPSLRFRDRNQLLLSGEFRWEARRTIELAAFYDTGKVFSDWADYSLRHLTKGYGAGVRLKPGATLFVRLDVARSREGTLVHVNIGPAF
jgi:outer membrane protein assembly factor BamA